MMYTGNARSYEKADYIDRFTVLFAGKNLMLGGKTFALGQIATDVLNMEQQDIIDLTVESAKFADYAKRKLMTPQKKRTPAAFFEVEEKLSRVLDMVSALPLYRDLEVDWTQARRFLTVMNEQQPEVVEQFFTPVRRKACWQRIGLSSLPASALSSRPSGPMSACCWRSTSSRS